MNAVSSGLVPVGESSTENGGNIVLILACARKYANVVSLVCRVRVLVCAQVRSRA